MPIHPFLSFKNLPPPLLTIHRLTSLDMTIVPGTILVAHRDRPLLIDQSLPVSGIRLEFKQTMETTKIHVRGRGCAAKPSRQHRAAP